MNKLVHNFNFWMSGEIQNDVGDYYRIARNIIEPVLNQCVEGKSYGEGLKEWAYLAIILKPGIDEYYPEIKRYRKKKREVEFRLKIDHAKFLEGDSKMHLKLLSQSVLRSLELMKEMNIKNFDLPQLIVDVNRGLSEYL
jgi:hypothetical protein